MPNVLKVNVFAKMVLNRRAPSVWTLMNVERMRIFAVNGQCVTIHLVHIAVTVLSKFSIEIFFIIFESNHIFIE